MLLSGKEIEFKRLLFPFFQFILIISIISCTPTKYVPEDNYLLIKNKIKIEDKSISKNEIKPYLKQQPNKKIIGLKFHLSLYNLSNIKKEKWPHSWLRKIGEKPVIWNQDFTNTTNSQFKQYLENKGYYHSEVTDTVKLKKKHAIVTYEITPNTPYYVDGLRYAFEDITLQPIIVADTGNTLLKKGMLFDKEVLQKERIRIENHLKNNGYYKFSKEYIYFEAQPGNKSNQVDLTMIVKEYQEGWQDQKTKIRYHKKYKINNIYVYPNYKSVPTLSPITKVNDTINYNNIYYLFSEDPRIKFSIINNSNFILPGDYYNQIDVTKTYNKLSSLGLFKYINISFNELNGYTENTNNDYLIDCNIELTKRDVQSYQFQIVGTNSSGDFGARGNLLYHNWNLFRGAETFDLKFTGAYEAIQEVSASGISHTLELGTEFRINFPKFLLPLRSGKFVKKYAPKTSVSISYNYQARLDFSRTIANSSFGYNWKGNENITYYVYPLDINYVQLPYKSEEFTDLISGTYMEFSYENHLIGGNRFGFEFNNQKIGKIKDFVFLRLNIESAGNVMYGVSELINADKDSLGVYKVFNVPYSHYLKTDIDLRLYNIIDPSKSIIWRIFMGCAYPYGNSNALPFEKRYFSGGPNSVRAWSTRTLGPGSYLDPTISDIPNTMADIKLETNLEYRFKLFWKLEGALFLDAGNIWAINPKDDRPGALFDFNKFLREIAIGTGFGTRFDFSFFLLRLDFGFKLRDPSFTENKWLLDRELINSSEYKERKDLYDYKVFNFQFGIGYPF